MKLARDLLLIAALATSAGAQSIASRVNQAPDGVVRMEFESRPGTCGDGRDMIAYGNAMFAHNFQSVGRWHSDRCVAGSLRVSLMKTGGDVDRMDTQVGGAWPNATGRVTNLGVVDSREASAYFFSLAPRLQGARGKDRSLLPAVLAADADVLRPLLGVARNEDLRLDTRRQAVHWLGIMGDATVVPALKEFARTDVDDDGDDKPGRNGLATAAMAALSNVEDGAGVPALIELAHEGSIGTRRNAVFWLRQNGDPRAIRTLHEVIENSRESDRVREHAIFSLGQSSDVGDSERAYLRGVYPRLGVEKLKETVFQGQTQDESDAAGKWLVGKALDTREPLGIRKSALFWAGQREATPTPELVRAYREADAEGLKEHAIFVLSQRNDEAATNALLDIARDAREPEMRRKALFWLGQKHDPRVQKLIADLILK